MAEPAPARGGTNETKPQMLAGVPQLWFQPVVATPGLGPWALRTDRLTRHLLAGFTTTPDSITAEDLAVFAGRLHAQGHPEPAQRYTRKLILPEMGRFLASTAYRKRRLTVPTVSLMGGADACVRPGLLDVYYRGPGGRPHRPHHRRRGTFPRR